MNPPPARLSRFSLLSRLSRLSRLVPVLLPFLLPFLGFALFPSRPLGAAPPRDERITLSPFLVENVWRWLLTRQGAPADTHADAFIVPEGYTLVIDQVTVQVRANVPRPCRWHIMAARDRQPSFELLGHSFQVPIPQDQEDEGVLAEDRVDLVPGLTVSSGTSIYGPCLRPYPVVEYRGSDLRGRLIRVRQCPEATDPPGLAPTANAEDASGQAP